MRTINSEAIKNEIIKDFISNWRPNNSLSYISAPIIVDNKEYIYSVLIFLPYFEIEGYKAYQMILEDKYSNVVSIDLTEVLSRLTYIMNNYRQPEKLAYYLDIIEPKNILNINSQMN